MFKIPKKSQTGGLITSLVFGIASLIVAVIIALLIVSSINSADLLSSSEVTTTVTNETNTSGYFSFVNRTGYTLAGASVRNHAYVITSLWAEQNGLYNVSLAVANATVSSVGVVTNTTGAIWNATLMDNVSISYTYRTFTDANITAGEMTGNLTDGIGNISEKIPTVLLIASIILIMAILVLLVGAWQRMGIGRGGI